LEDVSKDLELWRKTRLKRGPIPQGLQIKISRLSNRYPVSQITKVLSINSAQLSAFHEATKNSGSSSTPIEFVRLEHPQVMGNVKCHIKRADGASLECTLEVFQLNKLLEAFLCSR
jgi:hypothetical protein